MNRRFITLLIVTMLVPILLFAGEKPQTIMEQTLKNSSGKKGEIDTYSLIKNFDGYKATRSTSTFNPSKATYLSEGFEGTFPPTGWTLVNTGAGFVQTADRFNSGAYCAFHDDVSGQQDDWMVTPAVDLTGSVNARLTFYQSDQWGTYWYGYHGVYVTTDTTGIMGDTAAWDLVYNGVAPENDWEQIIIDLSAYDGQTIYVGFYYSGDFKDEWYIDDVVIEDLPTTPVMVTLHSELNAPTTAVGDTASTEIALLFNNGGVDLNISSINFDNTDFSFYTTTTVVAPGDTLFGTASFHTGTSGRISGTMVISGDDPGNPSDTVALTGTGIPASYIYIDDYNDWVSNPYNYSTINNNNDGSYWWPFVIYGASYSNEDSVVVMGIGSAGIQNDDYIITPAFEVQSGDFICFDAWVFDSNWPETWQVLVSTTDNQASSFTTGLDTVTSTSNVPVNYFYDLSAFAGNTIYVAVRSVSNDQWYHVIDNIVMPYPNPTSIGDNLSPEIPTKFDLSQNYPNPFNPTTTIKYQLPKKSDVKIVIYNLLGQAVRTLVNGSVEAGYHLKVWDGLNDFGSKISTGVYIYRMETEGFVKTKKMILMK